MSRDSDRARAWKLANPDRAAENNRRGVAAWRGRNPEKHVADVREWNREHPEQRKGIVAAYDRRRRARLKGTRVEDSITAEEWAAIKDLYSGRCAYCGTGGVALTQDHVTPLCKGGAHSLDNVVPACRSCNSRKQGKGLLQFVFGAAFNA